MTDMIHCRACGRELHVSAPLCPHCGAPQRTGRYKSKLGAGLLAIFAGGFGVHRFYLGQWWGLVYLLFCWTGIPALIGFVEGIVFLCTSDENWNRRYNGGMPAAFGESGGGAIIIGIVVAAFAGIAMIGILAAIAIPAYQDYVTRTRVVEGLVVAKQVELAYEAYVQRTEKPPQSLIELDLKPELGPHLRAVEIDPISGAIRVVFAGAPLAGASLQLRPTVSADGGVEWRCSSSEIRARWLPPQCR